MIFFEYEQVVKIHSTLISKTGGMDGVRDELYTKEFNRIWLKCCFRKNGQR